MDFNSIYNSLTAIYPEIVISVMLVITVLLDLFLKKKDIALSVFITLGLIVSSYFVVLQFNSAHFGFTYLDDSFRKFGMVAIDPFGTFFKIIVLISTFILILFSNRSNELNALKNRIGEYYILILGMLLGMFFLIISVDLILIYVSLELLSLSSYVLAGFIKIRDRNSEAALKYLIYGAVSSGIMLFGISIIFGLTGSTNLYIINSLLQIPYNNPLILTCFF